MLVLQLILYQCNIRISYFQFTHKELSTQVIVFTIILGGAAGFTLSWFSAGASLVAPPLIASTLILRSFTQQLVNYRNYLKFKEMMERILENEEIKPRFRIICTESEPLIVGSEKLIIKLPDVGADPLLTHNFLNEGFIKARMNNEFKLIEPVFSNGANLSIDVEIFDLNNHFRLG